MKDSVNPLGLSFEKEVPLLLNHKSDQPVGTVQLGTPTPKGLPFKAKIARVDEEGVVKQRTDEAWHSVKTRLIKGVSIGFIPQEYNYKDDGGINFEKAAIHELSLTAIPCNPEAVISAFKSLSEAHQTLNTPPEGNTQGKRADPPSGANASTETKSATRATLNPFFYPSF
ncbi:HK97 family phage prohead protease [Burkholderia pseudomallei]|uniref:HK97 family phage prohead protease n=1 Tax=Burkholderia pseudomallei TaxID=28450 RepID=UPI000536F772|nr:HK97 family phage prohead protease [Burkholderia pseudomallei]KGV49468.1 caudovirus prohead protease family protein [Burkholderia pseudomallei BDU 2]KGW48954.1 caudovirus prohead protease family protein [Burkholderia pseudomallei MSHR684]